MKSFFKPLFSLLVLALCAASMKADITVYYDNSASGWSDVNIYYWSRPATSWPGVAMTKVDDTVWEFTFHEDASTLAGFLFCNGDGSDQTADFSSAPTDKHIYKGTGGKGEVKDLGEYATDPARPVVTASPVSGTKFDDNLTVTLTVAPEATIYYTVDGTEPSTASTVYAAPIVLTESTTIKVYALAADGHDSNAEFAYRKRPARPTGDSKNLITEYYKVNPDGKVGSNKTINMAFNGQKSTTALSNWTEDELIAQGVARDVCQAFNGLHERPIVDSYAIYAAYDEENLYLGAQFVYTVWDLGGEGQQPGESKPYNMDGALCWAFDLNPNEEFDGRIDGRGPIWNEDKQGAWYQNGVDAIWMGSTKPGVGTPGLFFPTSDGHASYQAAYCKQIPGTYYGYADGLLPSINHIWGQSKFRYDPDDLLGNDGFADLIDEIAPTAHTFYEWKLPLSLLGITADYIRNNGIGVMYVDIYGNSPVGGTPYDPSYFNNVNEPYSMDPSTSKEKEDDDIITYAPARIGKLRPADSAINAPQMADDADAAEIYYNLQGIQVVNPSHGLFINVKGSTVEKVMIP